VVVYSFVSLITLGLFVRDLGSLLVGAGFLGIVVGMAARQTLGSVLAGFVLMFSRPFEIGDWVTIGGHDGVVADISIVHTHLRTADGEHVHLPNDVVASESLVNRSREGRLRLEVDVGIDYDADVDRAVEVARRAAEECDAVVDAPDPGVVVKEFGGSAVTLGVRAWVDDPSAERCWAARTALVSAIKRAFDAEGVGIPFPQRTVTVASDDDVDARGGSAAEVATADGGGVERGSSAGEGS
jgi:small-conductance mechanosensitive channel